MIIKPNNKHIHQFLTENIAIRSELFVVVVKEFFGAFDWTRSFSCELDVACARAIFSASPQPEKYQKLLIFDDKTNTGVIRTLTHHRSSFSNCCDDQYMKLMKPLNLTLIAAAAAALRTESTDAFVPNLFSSRGDAISSTSTSTSSSHTTARNPSRVVLNSSPFDSATPNDQVIREEYSKWRQKYGKGEFDATRYENFKANFMAVTVRNNMERTRARQNGEAVPSPIALNEYGDCSADEYRNAMGQQQQQGFGSGPRRMPSANSRPATNEGLRPANAIIDTTSSNSSNNNSNSRATSADLANASSQLRTVVRQRQNMESELAQMKKLLEEKKKLLDQANKEEQAFQERLALREEQKRLLNDRLTNGWEDERGMNNNNYY
jgi:hypothetical protein